MKLQIAEFSSQDEFENSDIAGKENVITIIKEKGVSKMDVTMTLKYLKSALKNLYAALKDYPDIAAFIEGFIEEYNDYGRVANYSGKNDRENGCWCHSYGIELFDDSIYIFVNQKIWEN